jgi:hypothetical protein
MSFETGATVRHLGASAHPRRDVLRKVPPTIWVCVAPPMIAEVGGPNCHGARRRISDRKWHFLVIVRWQVEGGQAGVTKCALYDLALSVLDFLLGRAGRWHGGGQSRTVAGGYSMAVMRLPGRRWGDRGASRTSRMRARNGVNRSGKTPGRCRPGGGTDSRVRSAWRRLRRQPRTVRRRWPASALPIRCGRAPATFCP